mmetsp:Transcript_37120/g.50236  ORF Transcript_37120/g.50236 Transcript_37120/m.50236 type:complete len:321 (-) Transcript_37120:297-1259(-)
MLLAIKAAGSVNSKDAPPAFRSAVLLALKRLAQAPSSTAESSAEYGRLLSKIEDSCGAYPFSVVPGLTKGVTDVDEMKEEVPFTAESIVTKGGKQVKERRWTCWMAEPGIGAFSYSGKFMAPVPMSPAVTRLRDAIFASRGDFFDCALLNWYPDGDSACKYHSDPETDTMWSRTTAIVSLGETRRFNFRPILDDGMTSSEGSTHSFDLLDGDVVEMFGECQESYQHCVLRSGEGSSPRISVVFKRSLPSLSGKRGHGLGRPKNQKEPRPPSKKKRPPSKEKRGTSADTRLASKSDKKKKKTPIGQKSMPPTKRRSKQGKK